MKNMHLCSILIMFLTFLCCTTPESDSLSSQDLFKEFVDPPSEARPHVRWWWNGNQISEKEIIRQLDILKTAGIGGVEINPIALPEVAKDVGAESLVWLSKEWIELLVFAAGEVRDREMITDLIVGSGWPFGGEFVKEDETIQRMSTLKIKVSGGDIIGEDAISIYEKLRGSMAHYYRSASYTVHFVRLIPSWMGSTTDIIDLTHLYTENNRFDYVVPDGEYDLVFGIHERGLREVMLGAPGAAGPVMDHYRRDITLSYLNRLKKISEYTGVPLGNLIRALFCDSIELAGANWTDGLEKIFHEKYRYRLDPYYPFIFSGPGGYFDEDYHENLMDEILRARFDYNKLLVEVFMDNFIKVFHEFCNENGMLSRYQAYGTPFLMGMMEGNMIADIPESNNWIYSNVEMQDESWTWNQTHGYMIWNLYASSGGHLTGKKIISNESMTNIRGVFKTSLDEIKQHDDMNFITGNNHAVLHGYNYSPSEAGFPGWIRYGTYFSEQNTWWPYFSKWVDYNARLSYVLQNSGPVKNIAIIAPQSDIWARQGLTRVPFHTQPWYAHRLWEPISQLGNSCDYISETIVRDGVKDKGRLSYGPMSFQVVILAGIESVEAETAIALREFVKKGGRLVIIDKVPHRSPAMNNASRNDEVVQEVFRELTGNHPERVFFVAAPSSENNLIPWTAEVLDKTGIDPDVRIDNPDRAVYQIRKNAGDKDIFFFTNTNRLSTKSFNAVFPTGKKTPWIWNPEDGTRRVYPYGNRRNELEIELQPLQSLLLVFDPEMTAGPGEPFPDIGSVYFSIVGPWEAEFEHMNGQSFSRTFDKLTEFGTSNDSQLRTFAGRVIYKTDFYCGGNGSWVELGRVNRGISEVFINGKKVGLNWYGRPIFPVKDLLVDGNNTMEIIYTTVLSNYALSLEQNPTAMEWTKRYRRENIPMGLDGEIKVY